MSITVRQNSPEMMLLLRASTASHKRAQRLGSVHLSVSVLLAAAAMLGVLLPGVTTPVTLIGFAWAILYATGAAAWTAPELRRAALIQELFDVKLFGLEWNQVLAGPPPPAHEVNRLARRYRGDESELRDYYEIMAFAQPYDVLACLLENLGWGARVRRRYAAAVVAGLALWSSAGVCVAVLKGLPVSELLLQWFVPSLGLLLTGVDIVMAQRDTAKAREHAQGVLLERVSAHVAQGSPAADVPRLMLLARQIQDVLLHTRMRQVRVPDWFFRQFKSSDRADFVAALEDLRRLTSGAPTPTPMPAPAPTPDSS